MKKEDTVNLLKLCAAVCSPLSWGEKGWLLSEMQKRGVAIELASFPSIGEQPDFPALKKEFETRKELRKLCEAVMTRRQEPVSKREYLPMPQRYIADARYALLCGNTDDFCDAYRYFCLQGHSKGASLGLGHQEFWSAVLGNQWLGVQYVPTSSAKDELITLLATRYALDSMPEEVSKAISDSSPTELSTAHALLRVDNRLRPFVMDHTDEKLNITALMRAYWSLLSGLWEQSYSEFRVFFTTRQAVLMNVTAHGGGLLLLVGLIMAIRVGAPKRVVLLWMESVHDYFLCAVPESDTTARADINGFFDALAVWDAVENRSYRTLAIPTLQGPLTCIPLAFAAPTIIRKTGSTLPLSSLVEAVEVIDKRGLHLLSVYAASALINIPSLEESDIRILRRVMEPWEFTPLYPPTEQGLLATHGKHQLSMLVEDMHAERSEWLYWDLVTDSTHHLIRLEPRLVEKKPQSTGRSLLLSELMDGTQVDCQDERDMALVSLAKTLGKERGKRGLPLLAQVLAGHPRLRLVQGAYRRLVRVQKRRPIIHVAWHGKIAYMAMDNRQFNHVRDEGDGVLSIPAFNPRMQVLVDYFSNGPIRMDARKTDELRWLLSRLAEDFDFEGDIPEEYHTLTPSAMKPVVQVIPESKGTYRFELRVEHVPGSTELSVPGQGPAVLLLEDATHNATCVQRDPEGEVMAAQRVLQACPSLQAAGISPDFRWRLPKNDRLLQMLHELGQQQVSLQWEKGTQPIQVLPSEGLRLKLSVRSEGVDWLEIGAELPVDESMVLALSDMLSAYNYRADHFIPLADDMYLHVSDELGAQLDDLSSMLRREKRSYVLPRAAAPAFAAHWQGELPEPLQRFVERLHECEDAPPPPALQASLREYQLFGYRWMLARVRAGLGACLADDMGLGKTVQMLAVLLERAAEGPCLVVAPLSLCSNWVAEAARFAPSLRMVEYSAIRKDEQYTPQSGDVVVASYGQVVAQESFFCAVLWNIAVLDEAQAIKNPTSRRAAVLCKLQTAARICLTGTPVENRLLDLWSIMHFLNPHLLGPRSHYARSTPEGIESVQRIVAPLVLRRTKQEVLPQLPPITEVEIGVEFSAEERALYESCRREAVRHVESGSEGVTLLAELTRLRRLCCHGKLALGSFCGQSSKLVAMADLVEELRSAGHRALVFSQFTDVLDLAQELLAGRGITTLRLDGSTSVTARRRHVKAFQDGQADAFLISLKAGGYGLNLTAADYVILLDPWWNPAVEAQAAGRSHRMGQKRPVTLCRLIVHGTVEERVMHMHEVKQQLADSVIREGTMPLEALRNILLQS